MPTTCSTGGTTGRGTVGGLSFGNGGYSISVTNAQYFEPTVAHELGHNYGYGHARLGPCTPCASEYGDYYSVMGAAIIGLPAADRAQHAVPRDAGRHRRRRGRDADRHRRHHDPHPHAAAAQRGVGTARARHPRRDHRPDVLRRLPVRDRRRLGLPTTPATATAVVPPRGRGRGGRPAPTGPHCCPMPDATRWSRASPGRSPATPAASPSTVTKKPGATATVKVAVTGNASLPEARNSRPVRAAHGRNADHRGLEQMDRRSPPPCSTSGTPTACRSPERPRRPGPRPPTGSATR